MDAYTVKDRNGVWAGLLSLACFAVPVYMLRAEGIGAMVTIAVCAVFVAVACLHKGVRTITVSQDGICVKTIFRIDKVLWNQVSRIEIVWLELSKAHNWYISVTWKPETNRKTWAQRWFWWMKLEDRPGFLFEYRDDLKGAIEKYRGYFDFDGRTVLDSEKV